MPTLHYIVYPEVETTTSGMKFHVPQHELPEKLHQAQYAAAKQYHACHTELWKGKTSYGPELNQYLRLECPAWLMAVDTDDEGNPDKSTIRAVGALVKRDLMFANRKLDPSALDEVMDIRLRLFKSLDKRLGEKDEEMRRRFLSGKKEGRS